jgi:signal transduction histidine kinase
VEVGVGAFGLWFKSGAAAVRRRREPAGAAAGHPAPDRPPATLDTSRTELRHALRDLCDSALHTEPAMPLEAAVRRLAVAMPLPVQVTVDAAPLAPAVEAIAYAVICESLANVVGHARARRVIVTVRRHGPTVQIAVADDGVGGAQPVIGGGIVVLAARVAALGGVLHVDSPPGSGTHVTVELPSGR